MTSDLGRVTTYIFLLLKWKVDCGDVRSRTSYNEHILCQLLQAHIAVTSDLGRVTTVGYVTGINKVQIAVTSDLGRVTTSNILIIQ